MYLDCNYLLLKAPKGRESNTVPQVYGMYFRLKLSFIENPPGGVENTVPQGCRMYLSLTYYLLLKKILLSRESNTVPQGYGMYFRL